MFNSLQGEITAKHTACIHLMTSGIEWEILMSGFDIGALPEAGEQTRVWTWLCHREDSMTLFGFTGEDQRELFFALLKVEGIGPKAALKILSGISRTEFIRALETSDIARLEAVPGLGKKTAQKIILTLKGKIVHAQEKELRSNSVWNELADALASMGYEKRAALAALERAAAETGAVSGSPEQESAVFRTAIRYLSGA
ncbi:MAG: Holliday junction branch migration protein RuvA [Spirochaetaceae bacterium]|nr:Holliday junction branch migration protein RuvA [Spirochaetaceae bacterium]